MARLDELTRFLRESLARGIPRPEIEQALVAAGWPAHQVRKTLLSYAESDFPVPVPRPARQASAGEAFSYLVLFTALAIAAHAIVDLAFAMIDMLVPDPAMLDSYWDYRGDSMRWSIARVVVALPVFILAASGIARGLAAEPSQRQSPVRRWLTYIAMFLAVCVLIGDFVYLVGYILQGDATLRFLLKVGAVAIVAGAVLGYYLSDLQRDATDPRHRMVGRLLLAAFVLVAGGAAVGGFTLIPSPAELAAQRLDSRRVSDLVTVADAIHAYYKKHDQLPIDMAAVDKDRGVPLTVVDPQTGEPYEYRPVTTEDYELCANFSTTSPIVGTSSSWTHGAGRHCFTLDAKVLPALAYFYRP